MCRHPSLLTRFAAVALALMMTATAAQASAKKKAAKLGLKGTFELTVKGTGKCLAKAGGAKMGQQFHAWKCRDKSSNQPFKLKWKDGDWFLIHSARGGQCLDVSGNSKKEGKPVVQWSCKGGKNQQWKIIPRGKSFQLKVRHSGKCLTLDGADERVSKFVQRKCNAKNSAQRIMVRR